MNARNAAVDPHPAALDLPLKSTLARMANGISPASMGLAYFDWLLHLAVSPSKHAELASSALRNWLLWSQYASHSWQGESDKCYEPPPED